jgi:hypothetical protein
MTAAEAPHYDRTLRKTLIGALRDSGAPLDTVKSLISQILAECRVDLLPTWDAVWERLDSRIDRDTFRTYLGLLGTCGGIAYTRRKIYLPR